MLKNAEMRTGILVASTAERVGHLRMRPNFVHMAVGSILVTAITVLQFQLISNLDLPALIPIGFFNLLFVFLLFPLEGPLLRKTVLLIAGNLVGALWYLVQLMFEDTVFFLNADTIRAVIVVVKPLLDFVWIVAVWSLSLSVLASYKRKTVRLENS